MEAQQGEVKELWLMGPGNSPRKARGCESFGLGPRQSCVPATVHPHPEAR